jgi:NADH:ubiquinone oxidoreductase subunit 5 (subunit L)/multisubunit Na+/H+ antiporter MnhA subunit
MKIEDKKMVNSIILAALLIIIPAIGTLLGLFLSRLEDSIAAEGKTRDWLLFILIFLPSAFISYIMMGQIHQDSNYLLNWLPGLSIGIRTTEIAVVFACIITSLSALLALFSIAYMRYDRNRSRYWFFFQLTLSAIMITIFSNNLIWLFGGIEVASIGAFFLISHWHQKSGVEGEKASKSAIRFLIMSFIGDVFLLIGFSFLMYAFNSSSLFFISLRWINDPARIIVGSSSSTRLLIKNLIIIGSLIKSAQFPILLWPLSGKNKDNDLAKAPLPIASYLVSVIIGNLGIFVISIFYPLFSARGIETGTGLSLFHETPFIIIGWFAIATLIILTGFILTSDNLNRIIIGIATAQLSFSFLGLSTGSDLGLTAAIFQLLTSTPICIAIALIFGQVIDSLRIKDVSRINGFKSHSPFLYWMGIFSIISFAGIFPTSAYFSRDMLYEALNSSTIPSSLGMLILALIMNLLIIFAAIKTFLKIFHGKLSDEFSTRPLKFESIIGTILAVGWSINSGLILLYYGFPNPHMTGGILGTTMELPYDSLIFSNWIHSPIVLILSITVLVGTYFLYRDGKGSILEKIKNTKFVSFFTNIFDKGLFIDNVYEFIVFKPINFLSKFLSWIRIKAPFMSIIWAILSVVLLISIFIIIGGAF